jgi:hypothetical protein
VHWHVHRAKLTGRHRHELRVAEPMLAGVVGPALEVEQHVMRPAPFEGLGQRVVSELDARVRSTRLERPSP